MKLAGKWKATLVVASLAVLSIIVSMQLWQGTAWAEGPGESDHRTFGLALVIAGVSGFVAAFGVLYWLVGNPLQWLRERAKDKSEADFFRPLESSQSGEMAELAAEINRGLREESEARLAALEDLRHAERLAMVEHVAAGIAHQLGTPISVVSARAELIASRDLPRDDIVESARVIFEQAHRMTKIVRQLLDFSRRRGGRRRNVDLRHLVGNTLELISGIATKAKVAIHSEVGGEPVLAYVDQNMIQQALMNIVVNAIQAMPNGGRMRVHVDSRQAQPPPSVADRPGEFQCITVEDDGPGIDPDHLPRLFEPFFTTKEPGKGTGLGLPVAHSIIAEHGGWIAVDSVAGRGSCFSILLPRPRSATGTGEVAA